MNSKKVKRPPSRTAELIAGLGLGAIGWGLATTASAQLLEDIDMRSEGNQAVLTVRFTTPVQYLRSVPARSRDLVQAFYEVVPRRDPVAPIDGQRLLLRGADGLPSVTVTDEFDRGNTGRKLVIRFDVPTRFTVRSGRSNRSIELVFDGLGAAAATQASGERAAPAGAPKVPPKRYQIVLQRSPTPIRMEAPLPRALAEVELRSTVRNVGSANEYELSVGPFNTIEQARAALAHLYRFPGAAITEHVTTEGPSPRSNAAAVPTEPPAAVVRAPVPSQAPVLPAPVPSTTATGSSAGPDANVIPRSDTGVSAQSDAKGREQLDLARVALGRGDNAAALEALEALLALPPNAASREAQALIGEVRQRLGDNRRARAEFETFLKLYPQGQDRLRVQELLAALPAVETRRADAPKAGSTSVWSGSISQTYYGGQSKTQTLLKDTPLEGQIPQVVSDSTISGADQKQLQSNVDVGWRYRDGDQDMRFSFRDAYSADFMPGRAERNKLSQLFFDYKSLRSGLSVRLGRQSGLGGGVLGRFDGATVGWAFQPKWKLNAVLGVPTDKLLDTKRHFYGASIDADALLPQLGGSLYLIQQSIDGQIDRKAFGQELRYVKPNATVFTLLEYDLELKGLNIASAQALITTPANSSINLMYDRRATPMLMLGNALFFTPPGGTLPRRVTDLLGLQSLDAIKRYVTSTTAFMTQATAGFTTPITPRWQVGADVRLTNVGAIAPVADIPDLQNGRPGTGNLWTVGMQGIGTNLYSSRDTHVLSLSAVSGPDLKGWLASYNNLSVPWPLWQIEPSLRLYQQTQQTVAGPINTSRVTPGLRIGYRLSQRWTLESDLSVEISRTRGALQSESATRVSYSLGYRYDY